MSRSIASGATILFLLGASVAGGCDAFAPPPAPPPSSGARVGIGGAESFGGTSFFGGGTGGTFTGGTGASGGSFNGGTGGTVGVPCGPGLTRCLSFCVDMLRDNTNCGSCGVVCPASAQCTNGACACPPGTIGCAGACVDAQSDPANCGACGVRCCDGSVCSNGLCLIGCPVGTVACGSATFPACSIACTDVSQSPLNCGACGTECAADENCALGLCQHVGGEGGTPGEGGTGSGAETGAGGSP